MLRAMRRAWGMVSALAIVVATSCVLRTTLVAQLFNAGAIDSESDPTREPAERRRRLVVSVVREELMDGYFRQGGGAHSCALVADEAAANPKKFVSYVKCFAYGSSAEKCDLARSAPPQPPPPPPPQTKAQPQNPIQQQSLQSPAQQQALRERAHEITKGWFADELPHEALCKDNKLNHKLAGRFTDRVRFDLAVARAAERLGELLHEGLVDERALSEGSALGFKQAAAYLKSRRWGRSFERPVTGLVVKGGAATGIYSAGVVWVALQLMHVCMDDPDCHPKADMRFRLLSGTSTGAMIVTAVDRFGSAKDSNERQKSLDGFVRWFTCYSLRDLYCVETDSLLSLVDERKGVITFDGIETILDGCVNTDMLKNGTELVLNVVDFHSGRLLALSDQGELRTPKDVVKAAVASAALPAIVEPVDALSIDVPVGNDPVVRVPGTYLDGGIRSEIPLHALARRGAERTLVVSSAASIGGDTKALTQAAAIAGRYIDVSTGGVTESELQHAQRWVESVRFAELQECGRRLTAPAPDESQPTCTSGGCKVSAMCEGRWQEACSSTKAAEDRRSLETRIEKLWRVEKFFRNETEAPRAAGYDFRPAEQRRLFQAGAEAARQRCLHLAELLGLIDSAHDVRDPLRCKLVRACSRPLPPKNTCDPLFGDDRPDSDDIEVRECGEPPAYLSRACADLPAKAPDDLAVCEDKRK
jgi:predicted acylesterase/phospholipase RssA